MIKVRFDIELFDLLYKVATKRGTSIPALVNKLLTGMKDKLAKELEDLS